MSSAHCRSSNLSNVGRSSRAAHPVDEIEDERPAVRLADRSGMIAAGQQLLAQIRQVMVKTHRPEQIAQDGERGVGILRGEVAPGVAEPAGGRPTDRGLD